MIGEQIRSVKSSFNTHEVYEIYALCMYQPTWERFSAKAAACMEDEGAEVFAFFQDDRMAGVIAVRRQSEETAEILGIAVTPGLRGCGIGAKLIDFAEHKLACGELLAETDDDAVVFYRKCGFETSAFLKNNAYRRYRCTRKSTNGER